MHLIRNSVDFVGWKERKLVAAELKNIYRATTEDEAAQALESFAVGVAGAATARCRHCLGHGTRARQTDAAEPGRGRLWDRCHHTGEYVRNCDPRCSPGELLVESMYRHKGHSAPAVIVAEFEIGKLDDSARPQPLVALTRANQLCVRSGPFRLEP